MIAVLGLNPATDRILVVPGFRAGATLKAESVKTLASGKGANVAAVLRLLGVPVRFVGFVGTGETQAFRERLKGIECRFVEVEGHTRTDTTIIDPAVGSETHIREPGFEVSAADMDRMNALLSGVLDGAEIAVLSGSLPPGAPVATYAEMVELCRQRRVRTLLDTSGTALAEGIKAQPSYLKPNEEELADLTGKAVDTARDAALAAQDLLKGRTEAVAVSLGSQGAVLVTDAAAVCGKADPPRVVNTVGCGDAFIAGWLAKLAAGANLRDQIGEALAIAAANAMTHGAGEIETSNIEIMRARVTLQNLW